MTAGGSPTGLDEKLARSEFSEEDREFIGSREFFFLATADAQGRPDCSYKGGDVLANPAVALLFIDFERPRRLRVNGRATLSADDPLIAEFEGAQLVVRLRAERIFPNCPRYIHRMSVAERSPYVPRPGTTPPVPKWKTFDMFRDVLPREGT